MAGKLVSVPPPSVPRTSTATPDDVANDEAADPADVRRELAEARAELSLERAARGAVETELSTALGELSTIQLRATAAQDRAMARSLSPRPTARVPLTSWRPGMGRPLKYGGALDMLCALVVGGLAWRHDVSGELACVTLLALARGGLFSRGGRSSDDDGAPPPDVGAAAPSLFRRLSVGVRSLRARALRAEPAARSRASLQPEPEA